MLIVFDCMLYCIFVTLMPSLILNFFYLHDMDLFKVVFYIKGCFVKYLKLRYNGGEVYAFNGHDLDFWSYYKPCNLIKGMESYFEVDDVKLWWKCEGGSLEEDLKPFRNGVDAMQLSNFVEKRKCDMKIYIEPKASTRDYTFMDLAREKNKGNELVKDVYPSNDGIRYEFK